MKENEMQSVFKIVNEWKKGCVLQQFNFHYKNAGMIRI